MRLFRGKCEGDLVYGSLVYSKPEEQYYITEHAEDGLSFPVDEGIVSQFVCTTDKNGRKIFEGDIVEYVEPNRMFMAVVVYGNKIASYGMYHDNHVDYFKPTVDYTVKVIGDVHDNPEIGGGVFMKNNTCECGAELGYYITGYITNEQRVCKKCGRLHYVETPIEWSKVLGQDKREVSK